MLKEPVGARFTESVSEVIINTMAHQVVARERNVAAPRGPNAVWLPAPPNAPARSAALPLCSMITITSTKHTRTCRVIRIGVKRQPIDMRATVNRATSELVRRSLRLNKWSQNADGTQTGHRPLI